MKARISEIDYSVSPAGENSWEAEVIVYGTTNIIQDFETAGDALNYLIKVFPTQEMEVEVVSVQAWEKNAV